MSVTAAGAATNKDLPCSFMISLSLSSCSYVQMMCCLSYICKTTSTVFEHPNHWILVENLCVLFVLYLSRFFHSCRECRKTCDSSLTAFRELLASCIVHACDISNLNVGFCGSHRPFNLHLQLPSQCFFLWLDKIQKQSLHSCATEHGKAMLSIQGTSQHSRKECHSFREVGLT